MEKESPGRQIWLQNPQTVMCPNFPLAPRDLPHSSPYGVPPSWRAMAGVAGKLFGFWGEGVGLHPTFPWIGYFQFWGEGWVWTHPIDLDQADSCLAASQQ